VSGTALVTGVLTTTAATVFNGGFASNADSTLGTDKKVQFRDTGIYINSSVDGQLDIVADTEIQIAATTIDVNGTLAFDSLKGTGATTVTNILDEDNMASDSATAIATQQSIKAYVDSQVGSFDTLAEVLAQGNTTGGTDLAVSTGDDITFADNSKAIFGAGSDLQIYHDGSHSYVSDQGTGDLRILAADFRVRNAADDETMIQANADADVSLWYNNSKKLATTGTGIDVTGTVTADGLSVIGDTGFNTGSPNAYAHIVPTDGELNDSFVGLRVSRSLSLKSAQYGTINQSGGSLTLNSTVTTGSASGSVRLLSSADGSTTKNLANFANNNDVSFYESTGTTPKFFWDASAESLGIGTSTLTSNAIIKEVAVRSSATNGISSYTLTTSDNSLGGCVALSSYLDENALIFGVQSGFTEGGSSLPTERMRIDSSGNVGIGTSSPSRKLHVDSGTTDTVALFESSGDAYAYLVVKDSGSSGGAFFGANGTSTIIGTDGSTERMRIDASGNVGIGVVPSADSYFKSLEIGNTGSGITGRGAADTHLMSGLIWDGASTQEYTVSSVAVGKYQITNGVHSWSTAPAGTAGNAATPQVNMILDASGHPFFPAIRASAGTYTAKISSGTAELTFDTSSARYKDNIRDSTYGLSAAMQLQSRMFEYKEDDQRTDVGFIAEEVNEVIPELVVIDSEGRPDAVNYDRMVSVLVKAIQEQQATIEALTARIAALES